MSDKKYAVQVKNVKKSFFLPHHKNNSLKSAITQMFTPKDKGGKTFNALNGISFNVEKGDFFGILGRNGSGKSTLLKIISEIYQPTSGSATHDGKLVSFIELGVGFKSELSGRENVFLNSGLLGFSKEEVTAMYDDIVEFAELEEFMDQKLKNYSSGMKVRLAFSVAIRAKADILILDEVLAVGDPSFQKKCTDYFETLKTDGKTVILVTHTMGHVRRFCNKAVVIEEGKVIYDGEAEEAADTYLQLFKKTGGQPVATGVKINDVKTEVTNNTVAINYTLQPQDWSGQARVAIDIRRQDGGIIAGIPGAYYKSNAVNLEDTHVGNVVFANKFLDGEYIVDIRLRDVDTNELLGKQSDAATFKINKRNFESAIPVDLLIENQTHL